MPLCIQSGELLSRDGGVTLRTDNFISLVQHLTLLCCLFVRLLNEETSHIKLTFWAAPSLIWNLGFGVLRLTEWLLQFVHRRTLPGQCGTSVTHTPGCFLFITKRSVNPVISRQPSPLRMLARTRASSTSFFAAAILDGSRFRFGSCQK